MVSSLALAGCGEAGTEATASEALSAARTQALETSEEGIATERRIIVYPSAMETPEEGVATERRIIVYQLSASTSLYMVDTKGTTRLLALRAGTPVVSPDGRKVAYAKLPDTWVVGSPVQSAELHVVDTRNGVKDRLTSGYDDTEPVWTPDARSLLFQSTQRTQGVPALWKVRENGSGLQQVTNANCSPAEAAFIPNPASNTTVQWGPNQRRIIVYSTTAETNGDVRVIDFDGLLNVENAYSLGQGYGPKWTDQNTVVYSRKEGSQVVQVEVSVD
ncbi:TolB family protein [Pyxidicoccus xibeiensis]|uniref:TolB family protein n=1 Tax=Pyxidicoccus xibeiensis TaxID=2906759 RepID=UPI0020A766D3|nr:hypothetical protein [Pyxidicoccus xibeiensis]MCP3139037.1 hypothetical protein [Pyxidicoccus xibeiensis]